MKNNKVLGALLTAGFCASTMMACGVYGAPEDYEEINVSETEETDEVISTEKENIYETLYCSNCGAMNRVRRGFINSNKKVNVT